MFEAFQGGEERRRGIACEIPAETVCAGVCREAAGTEKEKQWEYWSGHMKEGGRIYENSKRNQGED